jgi:small-conductance mechanosensitive channel
VTIGYDAPWRTVHELLIRAANNTEGVSNDPQPFVLQTSLDDFYISYQINAYIKNAHRIIRIKSDLHQNIQDEFNRAGVEIMSPHYRAERDGNAVTIPKEK